MKRILMLVAVSTFMVACVSGGGKGKGTDGGNNGGTGLTVSAQTATVSAAPGTTYQEVITVSGGTGGYTLSASAPGNLTGLQIAFSPVPSTTDQFQMILTVPAAASLASYAFTVHATDGTLGGNTQITLTVRAPAAVLLVDHDASENNDDPTQGLSAGDILYASALRAKGVTFDTFIVSRDNRGTPLPETVLANYHTVVWYTGDTYGGSAFGANDEVNLRDGWFPTNGDRRLLIISENLPYELQLLHSGLSWTDAVGDIFISDMLGLTGAKWDIYNHSQGQIVGVSGQATAGITMTLGTDSPVITYFDPMNPDTATTLFNVTVAGCTLDTEINSCTFPGAIANTFTVGSSTGTKRIVAATFALENGIDLGGNTKIAAFNALWTALNQ